MFIGCQVGDSSDVTLAFECYQIIQLVNNFRILLGYFWGTFRIPLGYFFDNFEILGTFGYFGIFLDTFGYL